MEKRNLLNEFFNSRSDANKHLTASQQEELENEFNLWMDSVIPNDNVLNCINDDLVEKIKYEDDDVDFEKGTVSFSDVQEVLEKYMVSQMPQKKDWYFVNSMILPCNEDGDFSFSEKIIVAWVNLKCQKPTTGLDILEANHDFYKYESEYGVTIFKWKPIQVEDILVPDEVVDLKSMKEYLNAIGV